MNEDDLPLFDEFELAEEIDPDWQDHFMDADQCVAFYRKYDPALVARVLREMNT